MNIQKDDVDALPLEAGEVRELPGYGKVKMSGAGHLPVENF